MKITLRAILSGCLIVSLFIFPIDAYSQEKERIDLFSSYPRWWRGEQPNKFLYQGKIYNLGLLGGNLTSILRQDQQAYDYLKRYRTLKITGMGFLVAGLGGLIATSSVFNKNEKWGTVEPWVSYSLVSLVLGIVLEERSFHNLYLAVDVYNRDHSLECP